MPQLFWRKLGVVGFLVAGFLVAGGLVLGGLGAVVGWRVWRDSRRDVYDWPKVTDQPQEELETLQRAGREEAKEIDLRLLMRTIAFPGDTTRQEFLDQFYGGDEEQLIKDEEELRSMGRHELRELCDFDYEDAATYRRHRHAWDGAVQQGRRTNRCGHIRVKLTLAGAAATPREISARLRLGKPRFFVESVPRRELDDWLLQWSEGCSGDQGDRWLAACEREESPGSRGQGGR